MTSDGGGVAWCRILLLMSLAHRFTVGGSRERLAPILVLWCCGAVVLWCCGAVVLWCCGAVVLWCCGAMVLWCCGVEVQEEMRAMFTNETGAVTELTARNNDHEHASHSDHRKVGNADIQLQCGAGLF
jgi:hypothetical protein